MAYRKIGSTFALGITNTPQPLLGSWVTAAAAGVNFAKPSQVPIQITLGTASSAGNDAANIFIPGEQAWLLDPNGQHGETVNIGLVSGNNVTLYPSTDSSAQGGINPVTRFPHVTGALGVGSYLMPKQMANNFLVTFEPGGTGAFMYIGCSWVMTAAAFRIFELSKVAAGVQPQYYSSAMFSPANPFDMSEIFVYGTATDVWNVSVAID
jgi:hypothetical protein